MWNKFYDHIFNYNSDIHSIRLHFVDLATNRIFQIVKYVNEDFPYIIYTDPKPDPYFSSITLYGQDEIISYFNQQVYINHWRKAPENVLSRFTCWL